MYAKLAIVLLGLVACSAAAAQAGLVQTNKGPVPPMPRYDDPYAAMPPAYEDESMPSMSQGRYESQQYVPSSSMGTGMSMGGSGAPLNNLLPQGQQQQQMMMNGANGKNQGNFKRHLMELGKAGMATGRHAMQEARPALNGLRSDLSGVASRVKHNPHVTRLVQSAMPHVEGAKARALPLMDKGSKRLGNLASRFSGRNANKPGPYEPGSVYPVPPQTPVSYE